MMERGLRYVPAAFGGGRARGARREEGEPHGLLGDLTVSANLPESYIPSPEQRMDIYRRIAAVRTREESQDPARRDA